MGIRDKPIFKRPIFLGLNIEDINILIASLEIYRKQATYNEDDFLLINDLLGDLIIARVKIKGG